MKAKISEILKTFILFCLLTLVTQIGGIVYLLYKPLGYRIQACCQSWKRYSLKFLGFSLFYLLSTFFIVPGIAGKFGRVPLPINKQGNIKPVNSFTWLANRHYVKPMLRDLLFETVTDLPDGMELIYLDANFPFINGFPLIPHLSHNDGNKIDLAFIYSDGNGNFLNKAKSYFGYGVVEEPVDNEVNLPGVCAEKGYWQYSLLTRFSDQNNYAEYTFDAKANRDLLRKLSRHPKVGKIFIEPHLKNRLGLGADNKIRFHGCQAVRHDDHIHLQL